MAEILWGCIGTHLAGKVNLNFIIQLFCNCRASWKFSPANYSEVNNYIIRSYRDVIVVTNIVTREPGKYRV